MICIISPSEERALVCACLPFSYCCPSLTSEDGGGEDLAADVPEADSSVVRTFMPIPYLEICEKNAITSVPR